MPDGWQVESPHSGRQQVLKLSRQRRRVVSLGIDLMDCCCIVRLFQVKTMPDTKPHLPAQELLFVRSHQIPVTKINKNPNITQSAVMFVD